MGDELGRETPDPAFAALDWEEPSSLPVAEVRELLQTLSKALRAFQLYDRNNPVYHRFITNLRQALTRIWEGRDRLPVLVEENRMTWDGEEVYRNDSRADSLSFLFFRDGVRELTLKKGLENEELETFLDLLHRARHARGDADDLVTLLWDADFRHLEYGAIDLLAEGAATPEPGDGGIGDPKLILREEVFESLEALEEDREVDAQTRADRAAVRQAVRPQDFNPTLHALDPNDRDYLKGEIRKEMERDLRMGVLEALFDRLEERARPDRQEEIAGILRTLLPNFLSRGLLLPAARILEELGALREQGFLCDPAAVIADGILDDLAAPESIAELVRAIEDGTIPPEATELAQLIKHLRPGALAPLMAALETTPHPGARRVLHEAVREIAAADPRGVLTLLGHPDPVVVAGSVRLVGTLGLPEAAGTLAKLLDSGPPRVRLAVAEAAGELPSSALAGALERALRDPDRDLRVGAARALGRTRYAPAVRALEEVMGGKALRNADVTEKISFFEAYARLAGERGIPFLDRLLNGRGLLGFREPPEIRAAAARSLGLIGTEAAFQSLERARDEEDPVVRSAVNRSFRVVED